MYLKIENWPLLQLELPPLIFQNLFPILVKYLIHINAKMNWYIKHWHISSILLYCSLRGWKLNICFGVNLNYKKGQISLAIYKYIFQKKTIKIYIIMNIESNILQNYWRKFLKDKISRHSIAKVKKGNDSKNEKTK